MRILWFTNTSCSASEMLGRDEVHGGWLSSLETELTNRKDIKLSICFYSNKELESFVFNKTTYYPVFRSNASTKVKRLFRRLSAR